MVAAARVLGEVLKPCRGPILTSGRWPVLGLPELEGRDDARILPTRA